MITQVLDSFCKYLSLAVLALLMTGIFFQPVTAQSTEAKDGQLESLRSDVGIHGFTANLHFLGNYNYLGNDTVRTDGSSELEFVYRNVRMVSQRLGVGYQVQTSFFVNGEGSSFGIGSWGLGPVLRAYPFKNDQVQPYVQANALFGRNFGLNTLANSREIADGFRVRLGLRGGVALRLNNSIGLFAEAGYDWEGPRIFKADSRAFQANIGIDFYLFN